MNGGLLTSKVHFVAFAAQFINGYYAQGRLDFRAVYAQQEDRQQPAVHSRSSHEFSPSALAAVKLSGVSQFLGRSYVGIVPISIILTMSSGVLGVLSAQPTDEEICHLEHEDMNPRKVEQEPEEEPEQEPEEKPKEEPEEKPEEKPEEEPVPLPVPVGGNLSSLTAPSVSFKELMKRRVRLPNGMEERPPFEEC